MESIRKNAKKARSRRGPNAACHGWRLVYMLHCVTPVGARCASLCELYSFRKMTYHVRDTAAHVCRRQTTKASKSIDAYVVACLSFSLWSLNPGRDSRDYCTLYSESSTTKSRERLPGLLRTVPLVFHSVHSRPPSEVPLLSMFCARSLELYRTTLGGFSSSE